MIILTLFHPTGNNKQDFAIEEKSKEEGINGDKKPSAAFLLQNEDSNG